MKVSVILPTYRRVADALRAIASLRQVRSPAASFEIVVVDNDVGASAELRNATQAESQPGMQYVHEPRQGLHNARHAGARAARGEILVYTDDDATFDPGWLEALARAFDANPGMMVAGGPVRPVWAAAPPEWLLQMMERQPIFWPLSIMDCIHEFRLGPTGVFFGVNMAIRKSALFESGGFNPECFGERWLGDGERGVMRRAVERGWQIGYVPDAVVYHHIPERRMTIEYFRHRMANQGACDAYTRLHAGNPGRRVLLRELVRRLAANRRLLLRAWRQRGRTDRAAIDAQLEAASQLSQMRFTMRYVLDAGFRDFVHKTNWLTAEHGGGGT